MQHLPQPPSRFDILRDSIWQTLAVCLLLVTLFFGPDNWWAQVGVVALFLLLLIYDYWRRGQSSTQSGRLRTFFSGVSLGLLLLTVIGLIVLLVSPSVYVTLQSRVLRRGIPIETFKTTVFGFGGEDERTPTGGRGIVVVINNDGFDKDYRFSYTLPTDLMDSYAGMAFTLDTPIDLTAYRAVEVGVVFETPDANCGFYLKDESLISSAPLVIGKNDNLPNDVESTSIQNQKKLHISTTIVLQGLKGELINKKKIKEFGLVVSPYFAKDHGVCKLETLSLYR